MSTQRIRRIGSCIVPSALAVFCGLAACEAESVSQTQVIVLVGGDPSVSSLNVRIYDESGRELSSNRTIDLSQRAPGRLPTSFTVVPAEGATSQRFRLRVQGFATCGAAASQTRARVEALVTFSPGESVVLPLVLSPTCAEEACDCGPLGACEQVCVPARDDETTGTCAAIPVYADLTRIVPGEELDSLARGLGPCPRGTLPDADGRCVDLDECAFFLDACQVSPRACRNLPPQEGRYECVCPQGCSGTGEADNPCRGCSDESCRAEDAEVAR